jgi:hypothetical protein
MEQLGLIRAAKPRNTFRILGTEFCVDVWQPWYHLAVASVEKRYALKLRRQVPSQKKVSQEAYPYVCRDVRTS